MINRVVLVGRLTKDPELSYTSSGLAISRFTLAVNRTFSNQQGEREADFIGCVCFKKQAENVANYLKKGSLAGVDGRIQTGSYEKDGRRVYTTDVIADNVQFLEPRNSSAESRGNSFTPPTQGYGGQSQGQAQQNPFGGAPSNTGFQKGNDDPFANAGKTIDISDDDLPF